MKLTKYEHACVVLEEQGQKLIIDAGAFTTSLTDFSNVSGLVVTHQHPDHFDLGHIEATKAANPALQIFIPADMADKIPGAHVVHGGDTANAGPFDLRFYGEKHAFIHSDFEPPDNIGVMVNDVVYYPGDSFVVPDRAEPIALLAPVSAPWLKIGETIDFVDAVKPKVCIPTHNALLSEIANSLTEVWLSKACERNRVIYRHLSPGQSLEV